MVVRKRRGKVRWQNRVGRDVTLATGVLLISSAVLLWNNRALDWIVINRADSKNSTHENTIHKIFQSSDDKYLAGPLPLSSGKYMKGDLDLAVQYLKLPIWSDAYQQCSTAESEVSCSEIIRSAAAVADWAKARHKGTIRVHGARDHSFGDRLSMLYHGLQIAIFTGRNLEVDHDAYKPFVLPKEIKDREGSDGVHLASNELFQCENVSIERGDLVIVGPAWPQALYTHPSIAPWLRSVFGFHSAHFLGNWLFGSRVDCKLDPDCIFGIDGYHWEQDSDMLRPAEYDEYLERCGARAEICYMVTNDEVKTGLYGKIMRYSEKEQQQAVCGIRQLMACGKIVQTFGSRIGFWANAMQGCAGSFINGIDRICSNFTNSQCGSIWHTYCPWEKAGYLYRVNSRLNLCGVNAGEDVKHYVDYLLW
jgi:hypothetical protein